MHEISVVGVQIAEPMVVRQGSRLVRTGMDKRSVARAEVTLDGLVGDVVVDQVHHGGPDQAVYVYSAVDLAWWAEELSTELEQGQLRPGSFGENLTLSGFGSDDPHVGDRYRIGQVVLEVTATRIPCGTFQAFLGLADWVDRFKTARRPGFYARVITSGEVAVDAAVDRLPTADPIVTVLDTQDLYYDTRADASRLRRALEAPVAERARASYEDRLARR